MTAQNSSTLKYFPERFRARHQAAYRLTAQQFTASGHLMPTVEMTERLQRQQAEEYSAIISKLPFEQRPLRPTLYLNHVMACAVHLGRFHVCGRQIYDISPRMLKVFSSADYGDVPASMFVLPFPSLYLHFGPQPFSIKGAPFEGALVSMVKGLLEILFVTSPEEGWQQGNMISHPPSYLYLHLDFEGIDIDTPISRIVDAALEKERKDLSFAAQRPVTTDHFQGVTLVDRRGESSKEDLETFDSAVTSLDDAMNLVVNTIMFITSYRDHVSTRWSDNTPQDISRLADGAGRPKQVVQAKARVIEGGYYKTHFVGEASDHAEDLTDDFLGGGGTLEPHWRRAHWRMQVCGEGRQDRKLKLIRRVLVNAEKLSGDSELPGRISRV